MIQTKSNYHTQLQCHVSSTIALISKTQTKIKRPPAKWHRMIRKCPPSLQWFDSTPQSPHLTKRDCPPDHDGDGDEDRGDDEPVKFPCLPHFLDMWSLDQKGDYIGINIVYNDVFSIEFIMGTLLSCLMMSASKLVESNWFASAIASALYWDS